jgi:hypothetical protein
VPCEGSLETALDSDARVEVEAVEADVVDVANDAGEAAALTVTVLKTEVVVMDVLKTGEVEIEMR